ncbi:MAG: universal stress protein [Bacteroidetes bacterium]|nr:universal stress protein [Bacteroidota bacterium]
MKNILMLTDFSKNAKAAAETALILSQKLHTNLLLVNTFVFYPVTENYGGMQWYPDWFKEKEEESQERLYQLRRQLEEFGLKTLDEGDRRPVINTQAEDMGIGLSITDVTEKNNIDLIVIGSHDDEVFWQNHVNEVIRGAKLPVLVVPPQTDLKRITKAIYATDYDSEDIGAITHLAKIAKVLHWEVEVVHVSEPRERDKEDRDRAVFENHLKEIQNNRISYTVNTGHGLVLGLSKMVKSGHAGLLAVLHHHHSFFGRLLTHSDTRELLNEQRIPLLIFPAKE